MKRLYIVTLLITLLCSVHHATWSKTEAQASIDEAQAGSKIAGRNINNHIYADNMKLMAESEKELKSFLLKMKGESEKAGKKCNIQ